MAVERTSPAGSVVPELRRERYASKLDLPELTAFLDGGDGEASGRRKKWLESWYEDEDPSSKPEDRYYLDDEEMFDSINKLLLSYATMNRKTDIDRQDYYAMMQVITAGFNMDGVHGTMFVPTIKSQCNEEQKKKWLPLANQHRILGAYAQTELGHGSNVRGLETTATYDLKKQEFVVNTPTITAYKFWPGMLGHQATHAIVVARLISRGVDHGVHPFIVQIRSLEDHTSLPGITVGDIGPRMGLHGFDNGYLCMDNIRIPRDHMLMKYSWVELDGTYVKPPRSKISYGPMVGVRTFIVMNICQQLAKAVTIATRYSVVRKQGQLDNEGPECQVLDYQTQQLQLLPLLVSAYALIQSGYFILRQYVRIQAEIMDGKYDNMQELHATTCGMKAFSTFLATQGIETCRRACGGHGYSRASGLVDLYLGSLPSVLIEGMNTVLYLQTGRYLNKMLTSNKLSSELPHNVSYLGKDFRLRPCTVRSVDHYLDPQIQVELYQQRACRMVKLASDRYQLGLRRGLKQVEAWNESTCDWAAAANAHCHYMTLMAFRDSINVSELSPSNLAMMNALCALFATYGIVTNAGEFMTDSYMTPHQVSLAREQLYALMKEVRKEAIPLVDAFDFSDRALCSTLGRYDGQVYRALLEWAKKAPRNKEKVHPVYHKHLKNLLQSKL